MTDINDILARMNPKIAKSFEIASQTENRLLPTPSLNLNRAIKGFGFGRQSMLWGNKGTGKTAFALQQAAIAQKMGEGVAWIDAEKNFDKAWSRRMGVDPDQMIISKITSIADMADAAHESIKAGVGVLYVDSISALLPQSYFTDKGEMKDLADTGQIGTFSKNMGSACNMLNNVNRSTAVVLISQVRTQITNGGGLLTPMGGKAVEHMNSTTIKLWCTPSELGSIKGDVSEGNMLFEQPIGHPVAWTVDKNRGPGTKGVGAYDFYFGGEYVGIDRTGEVADAAVLFGLVNKGGAWYTLGDDKFQGRPNFVKWLKTRPDIEEKLYGEILAKSI